MALSSGLATDLASATTQKKNILSSPSTTIPNEGSPSMGQAPGGQNDPGSRLPTPAPSSPDPALDAAAKAQQYTNSFNLAQALASISGAADQAGMQSQSDYYGMLAAKLGHDPAAGYAQQQAGLQQALLGLNQQQLGYDANTLHSQDAYANQLYGTATTSHDATVNYLNQLAAAGLSQYHQKMGNYTTLLHSVAAQRLAQAAGAQLASQQQVSGYTSDAVARGAMGAAGTGQSLHNMAGLLASQIHQIQATGRESAARINDARADFINQVTKENATIANQRSSNDVDYKRAGMDTMERVKEINNALAKNALEVQADNVRKQQASASAAATGGMAAFNDSFGALQYQQQQSQVNAQMASAKANQFYNALQLAPQIQANGGGLNGFLGQIGFNPGMLQSAASSMSPTDFATMTHQLNALNLSAGDYAHMGFNNNQLSLYGLTPYDPNRTYTSGGTTRR